MFEFVKEQVKKINSVFGNSVLGREVLLPNDARELPPLEQEKIEIIEIDDSGAAVSSLQGYSADEKLHSVKLAIDKYRDMSKYSEIEEAIQEITDEAIVKDNDGTILKLDLSNIEDEDLSQEIKEKIHTQFDRILAMLKFNQKGEQYFRQWYIDGRMYFQVFVDPTAPEKGITHVRLLNPKYLTKVVVRNKEKNKNEYYYYYKPEEAANNIGFSDEIDRFEPKLIPEDHIIFIPSGFIDYGTDMYISYLHKAIKPYNNLRDIEDSAIIYRLTRAPERRVFYVDVSKMPPTKAEAYMQNMMRKFQNKMVYNNATGQMDQRKNTISMIEDFYLPRGDGDRGTKIETLPGGTQLSEIADLQYFYRKLLKSLKVPFSRFDVSQQSFIDFSRGAGDIDREELRFSKFINKVRNQFALLFYELLKRQIIARNILDKNEYRRIEQFINFDWSRDMHYEAIKFREELKQKLEILGTADGYVGKYVTRAWIYYNVFDFTDEEIRDMEEDLVTEAETGQAAVPEETPEEGAPTEETPPPGAKIPEPEAPPEEEIYTPGEETPAPEGETEETPPEEVAASISKSRKKINKNVKKHAPKEVLLFGSILKQQDK